MAKRGEALSAEIREELVNEYKSGTLIKIIAWKFGINKYTVNRYVKAAGLTRRYNVKGQAQWRKNRKRNRSVRSAALKPPAPIS